MLLVWPVAFSPVIGIAQSGAADSLKKTTVICKRYCAGLIVLTKSVVAILNRKAKILPPILPAPLLMKQKDRAILMV